MATPGRALTPGAASPAAPQAAVATPPAAPAKERKHLRHFILFLLGADMVVLFIYLLLVPTDVWENISERLQSLATLAKTLGSLGASLLAYFGLKKALGGYLRQLETVFDQSWFAGVVFLVTIVLWGAVLPVWSVELVFYPPPSMPPMVSVSKKTAPPIATRDKQTGEKAYVLEGLLLRPYEIKVEGARDPMNVPLMTVLKGSLFKRAIFVQLPCTLEVSPRMPGAEVWFRRTGEDKEYKWGILPDNGQVPLLPGRYDFVRFKYGNRVGSRQLEMGCPTTEIRVALQEPGN